MPKVSGSYQGVTMQPQFPNYQTAGMLRPTPPPVAPSPSTPPATAVQPPAVTQPPTVTQIPPVQVAPPSVVGTPPSPEVSPPRQQLVEAIMGMPGGKRVSIMRPTRNSGDSFRDIDTYNQGLMDHYK